MGQGGTEGRAGFPGGTHLSPSSFGFLSVASAGSPGRGARGSFPTLPLPPAPGPRHSDGDGVCITGMCEDPPQGCARAVAQEGVGSTQLEVPTQAGSQPSRPTGTAA